MGFFGVYRRQGRCWVFLDRSQPRRDPYSQPSFSWGSQSHRSPTCATTDDTALTEEDRFMKTRKRALLEQAAMREAKDLIDQAGNLRDAVKEARWQFKVHRRAKEILEDLGG